MGNVFIRRKQAPRRLLILLTLIFFAAGCSTIPPQKKPGPVQQPKQTKKQPKPYRVEGKWYHPIHDPKGFSQTGIASWYGKKFHGRKTSNGEVYDMYGITAAHKTLPHGTYVRVYNLENNKTIDVRINDRGPFVRGRIIDLSYTAAKKLGMAEKGTAKVKIVALGTISEKGKKEEKPKYIPGDYYSGNFTFQVGAFTMKSNAERIKKEIDPIYKNVHIVTYNNGENTFYRVRVGHYNSLEKILQDEPIIQERFAGAIIIAE